MQQSELGDTLVSEFLDRTYRGIESTIESIAAARTEPERLAFLALNDATTLATVFGWRKVLSVTQPLTLPMLLGTAARSSRSTQEKALLAGALTGATAAQTGKRIDPDNPTAVATVGAAAQHAGYGLAVRDAYGVQPSGLGTAVVGGLVAAGLGLAAWRNRATLPATVAGGAALAYATGLANDPKIRRGNAHAEGLGHGANLVVAGEALTLVRATLLKGRRGIGARLVEATATSLSNLGQMLIVDGVARR
jgi:hypothetical protein